MYQVVFCNKFNRPEVRIFDIGSMTWADVEKKLRKGYGECPICGPCSHTELDYSGYIRPYNEPVETEEEAYKIVRGMSKESFTIPKEMLS